MTEYPKVAEIEFKTASLNLKMVIRARLYKEIFGTCPLCDSNKVFKELQTERLKLMTFEEFMENQEKISLELGKKCSNCGATEYIISMAEKIILYTPPKRYINTSWILNENLTSKRWISGDFKTFMYFPSISKVKDALLLEPDSKMKIKTFEIKKEDLQKSFEEYMKRKALKNL